MSRTFAACASIVLMGLVRLGAYGSVELPGRLVIYQGGAYVSMPIEKLKSDEAYARGDGGHMPWRRLPLEVASVDAAQAFLPAVAPGWKTTHTVVAGRDAKVGDGTAWVLMGAHDGKALVRVLLNGKPYGEVRLRQPFGYWWYVTSARRTGVRKSKLVLIHPDGSREYLPGPLVIRRGRAYVPLRDLRRVQIMSEWDAAKRAVKVYLPRTDCMMWFRAGQSRVEEHVPEPVRTTISWRPVLRQGELLVQVRWMARYFPTFKPAWDARRGQLELHAIPLGFGWSGA